MLAVYIAYVNLIVLSYQSNSHADAFKLIGFLDRDFQFNEPNVLTKKKRMKNK